MASYSVQFKNRQTGLKRIITVHDAKNEESAIHFAKKWMAMRNPNWQNIYFRAAYAKRIWE